MSEEDLEYITSGRESIISDIVTKFKNSKPTNSPMHVLLVGQRGIGKTHTLMRIYYALKNHGGFKTIRLSEEEYSITSVQDLLARILEELDVQFDRDDVESKAISEFNKLKKQKLVPVIFIDNLQMIFEQIDDLPKLRSLLQEHNPFCIMSSALSVFDKISSYDEPFYNFMDIIFLKGLDVDNITNLIKKRLKMASKHTLLKNLEEKIERINGLHILTGGNPRLIHYLCGILLQKNSLADLESNFLKLLDQLTPYYQMRMEKLTITQRKIIDVLSKESGPSFPTELASKMNMKVPNVVTQLRRLEDNGIVETIKLKPHKKSLYQITERLYRIWRDMRSPLGVKRVKILIDFLKVWYTPEERHSEYLKYFNKLELPTYVIKDAKRDLNCTLYLAASDNINTKILDYPVLIKKIIDIDGYERARVEINEISGLKKQYNDDSITYLALEVSIIHTKCVMATIYKKYGNLENLKRKRDRLEKKLVERASFPKDLVTNEHELLHQLYERLSTYYMHENLDKAEKYNMMSSCMINHKCFVNTLNICTILIHKKQYDEVLKLINGFPKNRIPDVLKINKLYCLSKLNKNNDAKKFSLNLLNSDFDELYGIFRISGLIDVTFLSQMLNVILKNLSNKSNITLKRKRANHIALDIFSYIIHILDTGKSDFIIVLFDALQKLKNEEDVDYNVILIQSIKYLILHNTSKDTKSVIDQIIKIKPDFRDQLLPITSALEYIETENMAVFEKLHKEYRELTIKILAQISPNIIIPSQVIDTL